jgi:Helicase conserved C-terminal domain
LVDLLFFPTGGGKTEAYLGLAAFTIAYRRMGGSGVLGAGVSVIMRYTLRLLTVDQLSRAAGVVCALELLRGDPSYRDGKGNRILGDWPIEIGLWVGSDASPNRLGGKGKTGDDTAIGRVRAYKSGKSKRAPAPIKACPWCGTPFTPQSFRCTPNEAPTNLEIRCTNVKCDFTGNRALPVLTVDQPIYRRLPAFLIATIDKFASLPWVGESGAFFGHVDRFDPAVGFFGAAETGGTPLDNGHKLDPPDLIIQDELHLISGPLGTVAGLYETAIDALAQRRIGDNIARPKIVASTATVRRAEAQIQALFDRNRTAVFPPPGIDRGDSFFARTLTSAQSPARLYLGVAAQGRGPKLVFLRALVTLLAAAESERQREIAAGGSGETADPYMTALCYFNALRELGGARRIVEDEVRDRVSRYGTDRRRVDPVDQPFRDRLLRAPVELTSRESTDKVAVAKSRLEAAFATTNESIDVALATNMISVGLDITRLGLMVVQGQPKTAAEYIQATSRVGRAPEKPGLAVTILNLHKPRDRTHFEQFAQFHKTFYRAVEATSVTPWAPRALDRALAAVVVTIARHIDPALTEEFSAADWRTSANTAARVLALVEARAPPNIPGGKAALHDYLDRIAKAWSAVADAQTISGEPFRYGRYNSAQSLLHGSLDPSMPSLSLDHRLFVAERSMRDVEHNAILKVLSPTGGPIANADDLS